MIVVIEDETMMRVSRRVKYLHHDACIDLGNVLVILFLFHFDFMLSACSELAHLVSVIVATKVIHLPPCSRAD